MAEDRAERIRRELQAAKDAGAKVTRIARQTGLSRAGIYKFLRGEGESYESTLDALESWLASPNGTRLVRERSPEWPQPTGQGGRADRILEFFGSPTEGFRRMARNLPLRDFAKACLRTAIDDGWPEAEFQALYEEVKDLVHEGDAS